MDTTTFLYSNPSLLFFPGSSHDQILKAICERIIEKEDVKDDIFNWDVYSNLIRRNFTIEEYQAMSEALACLPQEVNVEDLTASLEQTVGFVLDPDGFRQTYYGNFPIAKQAIYYRDAMEERITNGFFQYRTMRLIAARVLKTLDEQKA